MSDGENLEENLRSENLRVDEVIILKITVRNYSGKPRTSIF
jgi:hypothetical protein